MPSLLFESPYVLHHFGFLAKPAQVSPMPSFHPSTSTQPAGWRSVVGFSSDKCFSPETSVEIGSGGTPWQRTALVSWASPRPRRATWGGSLLGASGARAGHAPAWLRCCGGRRAPRPPACSPWTEAARPAAARARPAQQSAQRGGGCLDGSGAGRAESLVGCWPPGRRRPR